MTTPRRPSSIFARVLAVVILAAVAAIALSTSVAATLVYDDKQAVIVEDAIARADATRNELAQRVAIARAELRSVALAGSSGMLAELPRLVSGNVIALRAVRGDDEVVGAAADRAAHDLLAGLPVDGDAVELLGPDRLVIRTNVGALRVIAVLEISRVLEAPAGWTIELSDDAPAGEETADSSRSAPGGAVVATTMRDHRGRESLRVVASSDGQPSVIVIAPLAPARRAASALTRQVLFYSALVLIPLMVLAWFLARAVTRPVVALANAVRSAGVAPVVLPTLPADEIGDLGSAIEAMSRRRSEDAEGLRIAVELARRTGRMLDTREILRALESALGVALPKARWRVVLRDELEGATGLPVPAKEVEALLGPIDRAPIEARSASGRKDDSHEFILHARVDRGERDLLVLELFGGPATHALVVGLGVTETRDEGIAHLLAGVASSALRHADLTLSATSNEKLAALGRLAAAVTHEINNALALVTTNVHMLVSDLEGEHRDMAQDAQLGTERVAMIARDLSSLSQGGARVIARAEELDPIVTRALKHAAARRPDVTIEVDTFPPTKVVCDAARIEQALVNLIGNACDAALTAGRPRVRVSVRLERSLASVEIADQGDGIPSAAAAQLFEPFYTTKGKKGTGLGLFISRAFARSHGGDIRIVTTSQAGTIMALTIPLERSRPSSGPPARPAAT